MPYRNAIHTVVETRTCLPAAKAAGMSDADMTRVGHIVASDPQAGDLIVGSGGCRKLRVAGRGKGKSGGHRIVTYYADERTPVYLLSAISKGAAGNFSATEIDVLAAVAKTILKKRSRPCAHVWV